MSVTTPTTPLPIQFLLYQPTTKEEDRNRFNSFNKIQVKLNDEGELVFWTEVHKKGYAKEWWTYNMLSDEHIEQIVRICLSRINGEAVLETLENIKIDSKEIQGDFFSPEWGNSMLNIMSNNLTQKTLTLYLAFNEPLHYGLESDKAFEALDKEMLELVPEYVTFCNERNQSK